MEDSFDHLQNSQSSCWILPHIAHAPMLHSVRLPIPCPPCFPRLIKSGAAIVSPLAGVAGLLYGRASVSGVNQSASCQGALWPPWGNAPLLWSSLSIQQQLTFVLMCAGLTAAGREERSALWCQKRFGKGKQGLRCKQLSGAQLCPAGAAGERCCSAPREPLLAR